MLPMCPPPTRPFCPPLKHPHHSTILPPPPLNHYPPPPHSTILPSPPHSTILPPPSLNHFTAPFPTQPFSPHSIIPPHSTIPPPPTQPFYRPFPTQPFLPQLNHFTAPPPHTQPFPPHSTILPPSPPLNHPPHSTILPPPPPPCAALTPHFVTPTYKWNKLTLRFWSLLERHVEIGNSYVGSVDQDGKRWCQNQGLNLHRFPLNWSLSSHQCDWFWKAK